MNDPERVTHLDPDALAAYLEKTRWFGGKGRPFTVTDVRRLGRLGTGSPHVDVLLVGLTYHDAPAASAPSGGLEELYHVPLACYAQPEHRIDHALVGAWEDPELGWVHAYDALHDRDATALWLRAFAAAVPQGDDPAVGVEGSAEVGNLGFHRLPGHDLDLDAVPALFTGEQSNSSVRYGEDAVLKLFRKITPGPNPDITTHAALTRAGSSEVAHLYGWVETRAHVDGPAPAGEHVVHLGMLQQFLRTASDGWDLALTSVRDLFADEELAARDAGGDFSGESARLAEALREVHDLLRARLPSDPAMTPTPGAIAGAMTARLDAALPVVPELATHAEALRRAYAAVAELPAVTVQRIHGDLHLGQTLRTALGWKIVDFEGEPAKPLAERLLPDSPWRDVAGMLRSFDYAPHVFERQHSEIGDEDAADLRARGQDWTDRNQRYFLRAYAGGDLTDEQRLLVDAYTADKAVYETVYETYNRPAWVEIPLAAVARIGAS